MTVLDSNRPYYEQLNWREVQHEVITEESDIDLFMVYPDILRRMFTVEEILSYTTATNMTKGECFKAGGYHSTYRDRRAMQISGSYRTEWVPDTDNYGRPLKDKYGNEKGKFMPVYYNEVRCDQHCTGGLVMATLTKNILLYLAEPLDDIMFKRILTNMDCGKVYLCDTHEPYGDVNLKTLTNEYQDKDLLEFVRQFCEEKELSDFYKQAIQKNTAIFDFVIISSLTKYIREHLTR